MSKDIHVHLDERTLEWFEDRPDEVTTVRRCEKCGLWFKPMLGHECKEEKGEIV